MHHTVIKYTIINFAIIVMYTIVIYVVTKQVDLDINHRLVTNIGLKWIKFLVIIKLCGHQLHSFVCQSCNLRYLMTCLVYGIWRPIEDLSYYLSWGGVKDRCFCCEKTCQCHVQCSKEFRKSCQAYAIFCNITIVLNLHYERFDQFFWVR